MRPYVKSTLAALLVGSSVASAILVPRSGVANADSETTTESTTSSTSSTCGADGSSTISNSLVGAQGLCSNFSGGNLPSDIWVGPYELADASTFSGAQQYLNSDGVEGYVYKGTGTDGSTFLLYTTWVDDDRLFGFEAPTFSISGGTSYIMTRDMDGNPATVAYGGYLLPGHSHYWSWVVRGDLSKAASFGLRVHTLDYSTLSTDDTVTDYTSDEWVNAVKLLSEGIVSGYFVANNVTFDSTNTPSGYNADTLNSILTQFKETYPNFTGSDITYATSTIDLLESAGVVATNLINSTDTTTTTSETSSEESTTETSSADSTTTEPTTSDSATTESSTPETSTTAEDGSDVDNYSSDLLSRMKRLASQSSSRFSWLWLILLILGTGTVSFAWNYTHDPNFRHYVNDTVTHFFTPRAA